MSEGDGMAVIECWACELCGERFRSMPEEESCPARDHDGSWCGGRVIEYLPAEQLRGAVEHIAHVEAERDRWQDESQNLRVALDRAQAGRRGGSSGS